jgi:hypothetical protein
MGRWDNVRRSLVRHVEMISLVYQAAALLTKGLFT